MGRPRKHDIPSSVLPPPPLVPFPHDINRTTFGAWLSGFCDAEACFTINIPRRNRAGRACFNIVLRDDNTSVLSLIWSYWQCGGLSRRWHPSWSTKARAQVIFSSTKWYDLRDIIIPHFTKFPLRSSKVNEFNVWKEAVLFACNLSEQRNKRVWSDDDLTTFDHYCVLLDECRTYPSTPKV